MLRVRAWSDSALLPALRTPPASPQARRMWRATVVSSLGLPPLDRVSAGPGVKLVARLRRWFDVVPLRRRTRPTGSGAKCSTRFRGALAYAFKADAFRPN